MGGNSSPPPAPPPPAPPNYAAANREAVQADIDTLGTRRRIEQASKLGRAVYDPDTGKTYDFTGLGEAELAKEQARINAETADLQAQSMLDVGKKYGDAFTDQALAQIDRSDPYNRKIREAAAKKIYNELLAGDGLTVEEAKQAEEEIRGAQAARGNILGNAASAQEALGKFELKQKLKQQRLGNASQYYLGTPITAQYQSLSGAQQGTAPYQPVNFASGMGLNANAGAQGAQYAQGIYGTQMSGYNAGLGYSANIYSADSQKPNPWMQGLGVVAGAAAAY